MENIKYYVEHNGSTAIHCGNYNIVNQVHSSGQLYNEEFNTEQEMVNRVIELNGNDSLFQANQEL
jgi:uncharacterized membrane protein